MVLMAAFTITSLDDTAGDTGLGLEIGGTGSRRGCRSAS
jgi:hypothetical protein